MKGRFGFQAAANTFILQAPTYTVPEAARYLRIPPATLRSWVIGRDYPVRGGTRHSEPPIRPAQSDRLLLSFTNLVEGFVLSAIRRSHGVTLANIRAAVTYVEQRLGVGHPLAHQQFQTDGLDLFVEHYGDLVNVSRQGQTALREVISVYLARIDRDPAGIAVRFYPFTGRASSDAARWVAIDPQLAFGRPVIVKTGIPTEMLAERFRAGDSIQHLSEDYDLTPDAVEEALRAELPEAA